MKIFIVDDSSIVVERLAGIIRRVRGMELVGHAADVSEATQSIAKLAPDLLILDLHMPGGSGIDVLKTVKMHFPTTKVIVLTNYPSPQHRKRCLELGADYFLDKSSEFGKLPEIFRRARRPKAA
jgi:DNA-binding NarL/FixJ family response regulator